VVLKSRSMWWWGKGEAVGACRTCGGIVRVLWAARYCCDGRMTDEPHIPDPAYKQPVQ
jgi:hypothetical protein